MKISSAKTLLILVPAILSLAGCVTIGTQTGASETTWEETATAVYEATGATLTTCKSLLDVLCVEPDPLLTIEKCTEYNNYYKLVSPAYAAVGDALKAVISAKDAAEKQGALAAYEAALKDLTPLASNVVKIMGELEKQKGAQ